MSQLTSLQQQICQFVQGQIPREALDQLNEGIRLKYAESSQAVDDLLKIVPKSRLRAQVRRYAVDDAVAGIPSEAKNPVKSTKPKGEYYVSLVWGNVSLSHIEVHGTEKIRTVEHRLLLARRNKALEPSMDDLFDGAHELHTDSLHAVLMVVHPKPSEEVQSEPTEIFFCVPYTDWKGFHLKLTLRELLEMYVTQPEAEVADNAWPTLKVAMQEEEKKRSNEE